MVRCNNCGCENRDEAKFCMHCGNPLGEQPSAEIEIHKIEAAEDVQPSGQELPDTEQAIITPVEERAGKTAEPTETPKAEGILPNVEMGVEFSALPEGALIHGRKYELVKLLRESSSMNVYEAISTEQFRRCPNCGAPSKVEDNFCSDCGMDIKHVIPTPMLLTVFEVPQQKSAVIESIETMCSNSEGLLPPLHDQFTYKPYEGSERYYLVTERYEGRKLSEISASELRLKDLLEMALKLLRLIELIGGHSRYVPSLIDNITVLERGVVLSQLEMLEDAPTQEEAVISMLPEAYKWLFDLLTCFVEDESSMIDRHIARQLREKLEELGEQLVLEDLQAQIKSALDELSGAVELICRGVGMSDVGKVRELNEDGFIIWELTGFQYPRAFRIGLYAVADGMGGHQAGEVASRLALNALLETVQKTVLEELSKDTERLSEVNWGDVLKSAFEKADMIVAENATGTKSGMGTTMVATLIAGNRAFIANVGDSRAYILRGSLKQITKDHSLVQRLVDIGQLTPEEARHHPQRNIIYRAIGLKQQVEVDLFEELLSAGDKLLLCSDGLCDMIEDGEIERVLLSEPDLNAACKEFIRLANENGGLDNITVVIVEAKQ